MGQGNKARIISCAKDANTDAHATRYSSLLHPCSIKTAS